MKIISRRFPLAALALSFLLLNTAGCGSNSVDTGEQPAGVAAKAAVEVASDSGHVADELLVRFVAGVSQDEIDRTFRGHGAQEIEENTAIRVKRLRVPAQALEQVKAALAHNPHVEFVERNFLAKSGSTPNDPFFGPQWHLSKISAPQGWDLSTGASDVAIAIVDSGVDPAHPDLGAKLVPGYNFLNNTADTHDVLGHGTAVAGSAAASSNNGIGVSGVAWNNPIMPLVVLDANDYASYSNIARAITYAADRGVRIINVSIGGTSPSSTLQSAVTYAWNKGALVFVSAMNNGTSTPTYPAACANAIAISSTDSSDNRSSFSSYGSWITLAAPGSYIYTTNNGGGYGAWNGTSFSSPIAAGLGALILSLNPSLTNEQVKNIMLQSADDLGAAGFDQYFGNGRINVVKSLLAAGSTAPAVDVSAPTVVITSPTDGSAVSGQAALTVSATDDTGVAKVELYLNGALIGTDTGAPFTFILDSSKYANGSYSVEARGYDAAGNSASATSSIWINNQADVTAPVAGFVSPSDGSSLASVKSATVTVSGSDDVAVSRMELYIDNILKASSSTGTLTYRWNLQKVSSGQHALVVKAFDAAGNQGGAAITVTR